MKEERGKRKDERGKIEEKSIAQAWQFNIQNSEFKIAFLCLCTKGISRPFASLTLVKNQEMN